MRPLEMILSILALVYALVLFFPKFPWLWKSRILPVLLGLTPLAETLGLKGPIQGELMLEMINAESAAFFNRYLKGDETINLEQLSGEYSEVLWGVRP